MEKGNQKRRGRRGHGRRMSRILAGVLVAVFAVSSFAYAASGSSSNPLKAVANLLGLGGAEVYAAGDETSVVDASTLASWEQYAQSSTENTGRIWTDKSVSNGDVTLTGGTQAEIEIEKNENADFLVGLSALSSTSNLTTTTDKPLDIVLVLDRSGSMGDWFGNRQTKMQALRTAVDNFIDSTEEVNANISSNDKMHRIAIVSYGTGATTNNNFTVVDERGANTLRNTVDRLNANGSTYADAGLENAQDVLENARTEAQKVVIFFTDGEPNHGNDFDNEVAADTVNIANAIKRDGTLLYTIGVFAGANPDDREGDFNSYMNAVSSNYPGATAEGFNGYIFGGGAYFNVTWGQAGEKTGYYKAAADSDELKNVFQEIAGDIQQTAVRVPTKVTEGAQDTSGYITFTDQLGDYMQVSGDTMTVVYGDRAIEGRSTDEGSTYHFTGTVEGNDVYGPADLSDLIVSVNKSETASA